MQNNESVRDRGLSIFFSRVYGNMSLGVGITAIVAFLLATVFQEQWFNFIGSNQILWWVILLAPFLLVWGIDRKSFAKPGTGKAMFLGLSVLYGFQFSVIPLVYSAANIAAAFFSAFGVFVAMSIYGRVTKKNLTKWGQYAFVALIGIIIASVINMFMHSSAMSYFISYGILIVFIVLTARDNQQLTRMYQQYGATNEVAASGLAVTGALSLYLDFINIFIALLEIFSGSSRN